MLVRSDILARYPEGPIRRMLAAIPERDEGPHALEGALERLADGDLRGATHQAVERLIKPDTKLAVLQTVEEPMVAAIVNSELPTWTRVMAASSALEAAGGLLSGATCALRYCRSDRERGMLSQVALDLASREWCDKPGVTQFLGRLEGRLQSLPGEQQPNEKVQAFLQLAMMEQEGVLGLADGSAASTGSLAQTDQAVVIGGVRVKRR